MEHWGKIGVTNETKQQKTFMKHACTICGAEFEARFGASYCSDRCRKRAQRPAVQGEPARTGSHACEVCGSVFEAREGARFCSDRCRVRASRARRSGKTAYTEKSPVAMLKTEVGRLSRENEELRKEASEMKNGILRARVSVLEHEIAEERRLLAIYKRKIKDLESPEDREFSYGS